MIRMHVFFLYTQMTLMMLFVPFIFGFGGVKLLEQFTTIDLTNKPIVFVYILFAVYIGVYIAFQACKPSFDRLIRLDTLLQKI